MKPNSENGMKTAPEPEIQTAIADKQSLAQAAVIIKSLPQWQAVNLLSRLDPSDCFKVLAVVEQMDKITSDQLNASLAKLKHDTERWRYSSEMDPIQGRSRRAVSSSSPAGDRRTEAPTLGQSGQPFSYLIQTQPEVRTQLLENEHPRNIALVLSTLPVAIASQCLESLDPPVRVSVIRRICEMDDIDQNELSELNYVLRLRHQKLSHRATRKSSGVNVAVDVLTHSNQETQKLVLDLLEQSEPELACQLERSLGRKADHKGTS